MNNLKVTQKNVLTLPSGIYRIEENFYVRVREGRSPAYIYKATVSGRRREIVIGSAAKLPLAVAKDMAQKLRYEVASGQSLSVDEDAKAKESKSFKEVALEAIGVIENRQRWKSEVHRRQWYQTIEDYAFPILANKNIDDVARADILDVVQPIWETKTETAKRLLGRLERIFEYAIFMEYYTHPNPARWQGNIEMLLPPPSKIQNVKHHEAASVIELQAVAKKYATSKAISHAAILFGILTACRVQEFLRAKWSEIDFENKVFSVPPDRRKDGQNYPHRVPLSDQAIALLNSVERIGEFIFVNSRGKELSIDTPRAMLRKTLKRPVTMHGCRSTFRDWCAGEGVDRVLAEKSLMHSVGNEVEQAYQRSDLLEQRRPVMQAWSDFLYGK